MIVIVNKNLYFSPIYTCIFDNTNLFKENNNFLLHKRPPYCKRYAVVFLLWQYEQDIINVYVFQKLIYLTGDAIAFSNILFECMLDV